jgi:hypothetical protein
MGGFGSLPTGQRISLFYFCKEKRKMKDYRKIYADYYGIKWDSKLFEVHHIDRDRENNDINNLVLVPKKLHREYHKYLSMIEWDIKSPEDFYNINQTDITHFYQYQEFLKIKSDLMLYVLLRNTAGGSSENYMELLKKQYIQCGR